MIKQRLTKRTKLKILLALFLCIFACALTYLGFILYDYISQQKIESHIGDLFDAAVEQRDNQPSPSPIPTPRGPDDPDEPPPPPESAWAMERRLLLEEEARGREIFSEILEINEDFLGMIEIPGLVSRQPYVHSKDNEEYLAIDFNGKRNQNGTIFLNNINDRLMMDNNSIIFGHHTSTGSMFARLGQYKNADTFKKSPVVILDGLIGKSIWIVFAAHVTEPTIWYTQPIEEKDEYAEYLDEIKARSFFNTDVEVTPDDRIITLSVCDYSYENMRFVIHARKLRDGEEIPEEVIATTNRDRKPYTVPNQQALKDIDMSSSTVALNPSSGKLFIYKARAGGVDRYAGDTSHVQGPFRALTNNGVSASNFISVVMLNVREEDENENVRAAYMAAQGVGGGQGITVFSANFARGIYTEIGVTTPEGVNARYPVLQNSGGLWMLYSVPGEDGSSDIYRQPLLGGESEHLVTVRRTEHARPLGLFNINDQRVVIWHNPATGAIDGARAGTRELFSVGSVSANARVSPYGQLSGTTIRAAVEVRGKLSFTSFDMGQTPVEDPVDHVEETPPPEWYIPPSWLLP